MVSIVYGSDGDYKQLVGSETPPQSKNPSSPWVAGKKFTKTRLQIVTPNIRLAGNCVELLDTALNYLTLLSTA